MPSRATAWSTGCWTAPAGMDILVNNAGFADYSIVEDMSLETFDRTVEHYLRAPFILTKAVVPRMREQGAGWIVNIGSVTGWRRCGRIVTTTRRLRRRGLRVDEGRVASLHPRCGRRTSGRQYRGQLCWPVDGYSYARRGATDSRHLPDRTGGVPGRDRAGDVSPTRRGADRAGRVQPALSVVAAA